MCTCGAPGSCIDMCTCGAPGSCTTARHVHVRSAWQPHRHVHVWSAWRPWRLACLGLLALVHSRGDEDDCTLQSNLESRLADHTYVCIDMCIHVYIEMCTIMHMYVGASRVIREASSFVDVASPMSSELREAVSRYVSAPAMYTCTCVHAHMYACTCVHAHVCSLRSPGTRS